MKTRVILSVLFFVLMLAGSHAQAQGRAKPLRPEDTPALPADEPAESPATPADTPAASEDTPAVPAFEPQPIAANDWLAAQVELSRRGFSCGSIDGVRGLQTSTSLKSFQRNEGLKETGELDRATRDVLKLTAPATQEYIFTVVDLASAKPVPDTWLGKSQVDALRHNTVLELVSEKFRANPKLIIRLNPHVKKWEEMLPGEKLTVPAAEPLIPTFKVARLNVYLAEHVLEAVDDTGRVLLHCPVSIARNVEKRPVGELHVIAIAPDPNYTFDPVNFPEVPEAQELGRKLIIPPGPNNPVGVAWIGLDRSGYGIHGTPDPEKVGRTESHGCFRLANWDARTLLKLVWTGLPVMVEQ